MKKLGREGSGDAVGVRDLEINLRAICCGRLSAAAAAVRYF